MFKNHFKIALRTLWKERLFTGLNLIGLTLGLTVSALLLLYVQDEWTFDRSHEKADQIYRLGIISEEEDGPERWASAPNIIGPMVKEQLKGVIASARLLKHDFGETAFITANNEDYSENNLYWADSEVLDIFTIPMALGNSKEALNGPNKIIISEANAEKYFGKADPLGRTLEVDNNLTVEITGVFKNLPGNSTLDADLIGSFATQKWAFERLVWSNVSFETYVLLEPSLSPNLFAENVNSLLNKNVAKEDQWYSFYAQPLLDIHLNSADIEESYSSRLGDPKQVNLLAILAFTILLIACINYMNLTTAKSQQRFKEVGINKTVGATKSQLAYRFYMETSVVVGLALLLSTIVIQISLPYFNQLADKSLTPQQFLSPTALASVILLGILVIIISGSYPAFYLSSFSPKQLLKTTFGKESSAGIFRKSLVVVQFSASLILIVSTFVFFQQLKYIQKKNLGFQPEQVVALTTIAAKSIDQLNALKNKLTSLPEVTAYCRAQTFPGNGGSGRSISKPGDPNSERGLTVTTNRVSPEFIDVLDMNLISGKNLPNVPKSREDTTVQVIVNEKVADYLGYTPEEAIGQKAPNLFGYDRATIVGVVQDFHFESLHQPIGGYAFHNASTEWRRFALVKLKTNDLPSTLRKVEGIFKESIPESAFEYQFLDQHLETLYATESRTANIFTLFAGLAILIACLGLFGLAAFTVDKRTKEIGIRKVLGASVISILGLLSKDFIQLTLISIIIAIPLAYIGLSRWLNNFAYHFQLEWWFFALTGILIIGLTFLIVSVQGLRTASNNPVDSLRYE